MRSNNQTSQPTTILLRLRLLCLRDLPLPVLRTGAFTKTILDQFDIDQLLANSHNGNNVANLKKLLLLLLCLVCGLRNPIEHAAHLAVHSRLGHARRRDLGTFACSRHLCCCGER